jgi:hypothetical protein
LQPVQGALRQIDDSQLPWPKKSLRFPKLQLHGSAVHSGFPQMKMAASFMDFVSLMEAPNPPTASLSQFG